MADQAKSDRAVTIIGAGIVGVCSALWLQREGWDVTVVDRGDPGNGASFGNAAMISPGQVVPYAMPGLLKDVPRWLVSKRSPFKIRPSYLPIIAPWLWAWSRAGQVENAIAVSRAMRTLHERTFDLYGELTRGTPGEHLLERCGHLYLTVEGTAARSPQLAGIMREAAGVEVEHLSRDEVRALEPALAPVFKSGLLMPGNGRVRNPHRLVQMLAREAECLGARFLKGEVARVTMQGGRCESIGLDGRNMPVQTLVVAAGIGSKFLTDQLGLKIPLETERGYHVTISNPGVLPSRQLVVRDWGIGVGPIDDQLRVAGTVEFCGVKAAPDWQRADRLLARARDVFPSVDTSTSSRWVGERPSISDGLAVLGHHERFENVLLAFGNGHHGMSAGPMMGKIVSELVAGNRPSIDLRPFSPNRF